MGSHFHASVPMEVTNTGSLPLQSITLVVTDPVNADNRLVQETRATVQSAAGTVYSGTLAELIADGSVDLSSALGTIRPGAGAWFTVNLSAPPGGYGDSAPSVTMAPSFAVIGSDI